MFRGATLEQNSPVNVDKERVQRLFRGVKDSKSPGPDGIGGRVLRIQLHLLLVTPAPQSPPPVEGLDYCPCAQK